MTDFMKMRTLVNTFRLEQSAPLWGDKCGEPLTSQLREIDIEGYPDDQRAEALISHRG